MKQFLLCGLLLLGLSPAYGQTKALVGGTLIDGFGGRPIHNSVILIEGDRIKAVGHQGNLAVPPEAEVISTEGMSILPGLWEDAHALGG